MNRFEVVFQHVSVDQFDSAYICSYCLERLESVKPDTEVEDIKFFFGTFKTTKLIWGKPLITIPALDAKQSIE